MAERVGPLRDAEGLAAALARIAQMRAALPHVAIAPDPRANPTLADWFELRASLLAAEAVTRAALARRESRGAHQRREFPDPEPALARPQPLRLDAGGIVGLA
jgi:succinate dehydrogenase/fumarate reductase flavoprotein subunit